MEEILGAVSTVGFPIAVACYVLYMQYKTRKDDNERLAKAMEEHTRVLTRLETLIETLVK